MINFPTGPSGGQELLGWKWDGTTWRTKNVAEAPATKTYGQAYGRARTGIWEETTDKVVLDNLAGKNFVDHVFTTKANPMQIRVTGLCFVSADTNLGFLAGDGLGGYPAVPNYSYGGYYHTTQSPVGVVVNNPLTAGNPMMYVTPLVMLGTQHPGIFDVLLAVYDSNIAGLVKGFHYYGGPSGHMTWLTYHKGANPIATPCKALRILCASGAATFLAGSVIVIEYTGAEANQS